MGGAYSSDGVRDEVYRVLVRKPQGKRPLGKPRRRWEDNVKMDLKDVVCVASTCECGNELWGTIKWRKFLD
jgi:hypothetical protein